MGNTVDDDTRSASRSDDGIAKNKSAPATTIRKRMSRASSHDTIRRAMVQYFKSDDLRLNDLCLSLNGNRCRIEIFNIEIADGEDCSYDMVH